MSILVLAFGVAVLVATLILILVNGVESSLGQFPSWFNAYLVVLLTVRLAALFGVWNLKHLAVYVLLAMEIVEISTGLFVFTSVFTFGQRLVVAVPVFLILFAISYVALRARWHSFT